MTSRPNLARTIANDLGMLGLGILIGSHLTRHNAAVISLVLIALSPVVRIVLWLARDRGSTVRCPRCPYTVGGPDPAQYYLEHRARDRHVLHGVYGPLAEFTNPAGSVIPAAAVSQLRPMSYNTDLRQEQQ
jgi:hypothetical protein